MGRRVSQSEDYIEELARAIEAERSRDPDVQLSWDWWREQAARFGVTPNNIYSRAISRGLYIPPSKRTVIPAPEVRSETAPSPPGRPRVEEPPPSSPRASPGAKKEKSSRGNEK